VLDGIDDVLDACRRAPGHPGERMNVGLPEAQRKGEMLIVVEGLAGKDHHEVLVEQVADLVQRGVGEGLPQVDAGHLGADAAGQRADLRSGH
jgi:hypothetical protein